MGKQKESEECVYTAHTDVILTYRWAFEYFQRYDCLLLLLLLLLLCKSTIHKLIHMQNMYKHKISIERRENNVLRLTNFLCLPFLRVFEPILFLFQDALSAVRTAKRLY